jgi:hypothetical protein
LNHIRESVEEPDVEPIYKGGIDASESNSTQTHKTMNRKLQKTINY